MPSSPTTLHERLYRSESVLERFAITPITICGMGALGANLAETLVRQGFQKLQLIDHGHVASHNLSTHPYFPNQVGARKVDAMRMTLWSLANADLIGTNLKFDDRNLSAKKLRGYDLVIDTFDNQRGRTDLQRACRTLHIPLLHLGLSSDGYGEVRWDRDYTMPAEVEADLCDYPLARNLVMLTVAIAAEVVAQYVATGKELNRSVTLKDLQIHAE